ncbi:MAG: 3-deoxy-D-manno-octulosonic acid transferase [Candidatus Koribacter versatilis]|uniref:3-deoxy-D-manno-octulosonic acid transferase n=1 Tax=Candidatus Korobacter versatilis TaxID=658062 RepID=A0A932ENX9_9BACT|nr:3-deoxy-D-manno-octulosonic acid transferase [Candidatus Koribacter versatilis]
MSAVHLLYSLAFALALLLSAPWWLLQMLRAQKYRAGLSERLGRVPARLARAAAGSRTVWVHAVSVGEVLAVSRLVEELRREFDAVYVSTTTATGQKLARERFGEHCVFYFPLDLGFAVRAYLRAIGPQLVVLAETEFWPNFLRRAKKSGAKVAVVNARISDRSLPGYRRHGWFIRPVLQNVDLFLAQTEEDAGRLRAIGAPQGRVHVGGNLKYDVRAPEAPGIEALRRAVKELPREHVIVAGSTVEGEEELVLEAFREVRARHPRALLVLAPRHPERFPRVTTLLEQSDLPWIRRSDRPQRLGGGVLLLDSIGELAAVYAIAAIAFVGGSLAPRGGHNILEPAQHGAAVLTGPHNENFRDLVADFERAEAVRIVSAEALGATILALIADSAAREALGRNAKAAFAAKSGATERTREALRALLRPQPGVADESDATAEARA